MAIAYLLLGTNIGCRVEHLNKAAALIGQLAGKVCTASTIYETAAWGKVEQEDYLNQVLKINTPLSPEQLLQKTAEIETGMGRVRKIKWGPRIIDIDILFYDNLIRKDDTLTLPHPYIPKRRFVLTPLAEIAPALLHPVLHQSIADLLKHCNDTLWVEEYTPMAVH